MNQIPELTEDGLLPEGIHDANLDAVAELFGAFQRSDQRIRLVERLRRFLSELAEAAVVEAVIVNGSFVMACVDEPEDIDLVVVLSAQWDLTAPVLPYVYNLLSKRRVRKRFGFDAFVVRSGSPELQEWCGFFEQLSPRWCHEFNLPLGSKKGLVRLSP